MALTWASGAQAAPGNDDLANATTLSNTLPSSNFGNNVEASQQAGEPNHAGNAGGHSVWFSWTPASSSQVVITTCSFSGVDTLLAVYTGSAVGGLTPVASNDDAADGSCESTDSEVAFTATAGTAYKIAVDGKDGDEGFFEVDLFGPPANDEFANAQALGGTLPQFASGSNTLASKQTGEPNHASNPGGHSVWFTWTPSASGPVALSACSFGGIDTLLAVYTGSAVNGLTPVASNDDSAECGGGTGSEVTFSASAGTVYKIAIDGKNGAQGSLQLQLKGPPANDTFSTAETIGAALPQFASGSNKLASKQAGEPNHAGDTGGRSLWFNWTPSTSGPVEISTCSSFSGSLDTLLAVYTGTSVNSLAPVASNDDGAGFPCGSSGSEVQFSAIAGTTYRIAIDGKNNARGSFELRLAGPPANDDFSSAQILDPSLPEFSSGTLKLASKQAGEPEHAGDPGGHSVWYSWTPDSSGPVGISTCDSSFSGLDTLLAVYTGSSLGGLTPVASNDDGPSSECSDADSEVRFNAVAGTTYRIAVDGAGESAGGFQLELAGQPTNDDLADAVSLGTSASTSEWGNNTFATKQTGEPNHAGNPGGHSVWFTWTPASSGSVEVSSCSFNGLDTLLAVYTGSAVNSLTPVASNDDAPVVGNEGSGCAENGGSALTFAAAAGTTYRIAVDGKNGIEGGFNVRLEGRSPNDDFAKAQAITGSIPTGSFGSAKFATKESGEPNHAGNPGGHSVWFTWTATSSGPVDISTCGGFSSTIDTLLAVYTGSTLNSLTPVASNDDGPASCGSTSSAVQFTATAGTTYLIAVDGKGGTEGSFELSLRGMPTNDDFAKAQAINGTFASGTTKLASKQAGEPNHAGNAGGHSVWFTWTPASNVTAEISSCSSGGLDSLLAVYTGSVVNGLTPVASNDNLTGESCNSTDSEVSFAATAGTVYRIAVDGKNGSQGSFSLELGGSPANDNFESAQTLSSSASTNAFGSIRLATKQAGEPNHAGNAGGHSIWYSWTPSSTGPVDISTCTFGGADTLLAVYTGSAVNGLTPVASNDDGPDPACESTSDSSVQFTANAGTTYRIAIDGKNGSTGSVELILAGRPLNDDLSHAQSLGGRLPTGSFRSNKLATKQAGEPNHAGNPGGTSIWFKWTAPTSGQVAADTCGSSFDTLLAVYTGSAVNGLTPVASNDDNGGSCGSRSKLIFNATAGTIYKIAVDGKNGAQGAVEMDLYGPPANDDFSSPRVVSPSLPRFIFGSTKLATKQTGEANHAGNPGGHSVWYSWTPLSSIEVTVSTCFPGFDTVLAVYTGSAVNGLTSVANNDDAPGECGEGGGSEVAFAATAGVPYRIAIDGAGGEEGSFELGLTAVGAPRHLLTVSKLGSGDGTVGSNPAGIDCGSSCEHEFDQGATITLTATPDSGSTFTGWSGGGCSGSGSCQVQLSSSQSVTANFAENAPGQRSLTLSKAGAGGGSVTSSPAGIDCGSVCSAAFAEGATITLTATPDSSSLFAGWSGACSGSAGCVVTMSQARTVTATFNVKPTEGGGGGGGGGGTPASGTSTPASPVQPPAPPAAKPKPKPLKCKAGFKKKKVRGKLKCVKKKGKHRK